MTYSPALPEALLHFVGEIYEAASNPDHWNAVIRQLGGLIHAKSGALFLEDYQAGTRCLMAHFGLPRLSPTAYRFGLGRYDYTFQIQQRQPPGQARQTIDYNEVKKDHPVFCRLLLKPNDIGYVCAMNVFKDQEWHVGLGLHRSLDGTPFGAEELRLLELLYPHFKRALRIQRELHRLRGREQTLAATLSRLTLGVIVLDRSQQVVHINHVAKKLLAEHAGLGITNDRLRAHYPQEDAQLTDTIAKLAQADPADVEYRDLALGLHHPDREFPLTVMLTTLNDPHDSLMPAAGRVALYLSAADASVSIPAEALQSVYEMTAAEAKVAISLANGLDVRQISAQNGVGLETVRSQLKAVFSKMGVSKQQDVIRLLLSGALRVEPSRESDSAPSQSGT